MVVVVAEEACFSEAWGGAAIGLERRKAVCAPVCQRIGHQHCLLESSQVIMVLLPVHILS